MNNTDIVVPLNFVELSAGSLHSRKHPLFGVRHRVVLQVAAAEWPPSYTPARYLIDDLEDLGYRVAIAA